MLTEPFYDPARSYLENFEQGPFSFFAERCVYQDRGEPRYKFLGHEVNLPLGIAAGPLLNGRFVKAALDKGFDLPVYKTVRTRKYASHEWPNVLAVHPKGDLGLDTMPLVGDEDYSEPLSITNSFGVPSFDPEFWQPDIADAVAHAKRGQVVAASFQGTTSGHGDVQAYIEDFALAARLLKETGVKIIEANLSCPNEGTANLLCFDVDRARRVVERIRDEIGSLGLMVKAAYFRDEERLRTFVSEVGPVVDGIVAINTLPAKILDANGGQALPGEGRLSSGVCGRSIRWAGLEMSGRLARLREEMGLNFSIIGVGGLSDANDYHAYRKAGADAAMMATAAMWNPRLAQEIKAQETKEAMG
jgi:dihydroorotate dehydrogenase (NAD+) catalytic subunit